ncbi:unnamed protein product [Phaedon cochleariae]|uniref:Sigma-54 factor interaction domain-containing protein n=1 Tax=Phaedon cochleariae TaxID=80249 RepID=A0A9N9X3Q3_PHACE|nr:unnamed protein product [Phaedon cochleariae]
MSESSGEASGEVFGTPKGTVTGRSSPYWLEDTFGSSVLELSGNAQESEGKGVVLEGDEEFVVRRYKRKRQGTPSMTAEAKIVEANNKELSEYIGKLKKNSEQLTKLLGSNPNTQKGIKQTIEDLSYIIKNFARRHEEWKADHCAAMQRDETACTEPQVVVQMREIGTQTHESWPGTREISTQTREAELVTLDGVEGFEAVLELIDKEWSDETFTATRVEHSDPGACINRMDTALVIDPEDKGEKGVMKVMHGKFPEAREMLSTLKEGTIKYLMRATKTFTSRGEDNVKTGYVYLLPHIGESTGEESLERLYNLFVSLKEILVAEKRSQIYVALREGLNRDSARKMLECVLHETEITAAICTPDTERRRTFDRQRSRKPVETVTVKAEGKTYAELLRSVKDGVNIENIGVSISKVRRSQKGDLVLTVEGGKGMAEALREEIAGKLQTAVVKARTNGTMLFIAGIDAATTPDESDGNVQEIGEVFTRTSIEY